FRDQEQKDTFSIKPSTGYTFGVLVGFPLKNKYSVVLEGSFSRKGRILEDETTLQNHSRYTFLEGTMLLRKSWSLHFADHVPGEWFLNIGPEVGYWHSGKGYFTAGGPKYPYVIEFDKEPDGDMQYLYYNNANRMFFGLVLGAGIKAPLRNNSFISAELRFVSGHTNLGTNHYDYHPRLWYASLLGYND